MRIFWLARSMSFLQFQQASMDYLEKLKHMHNMVGMIRWGGSSSGVVNRLIAICSKKLPQVPHHPHSLNDSITWKCRRGAVDHNCNALHKGDTFSNVNQTKGMNVLTTMCVLASSHLILMEKTLCNARCCVHRSCFPRSCSNRSCLCIFSKLNLLSMVCV